MTQAQEILSGLIYDPEATRSYDIMRGGFVWSDEVPCREKEYAKFLKSIFLLSKVIAYRASLTLSEPREEFKGSWDELFKEVPEWPGFRPERCEGVNIRDLKAVKLKEAKGLKDLEKELD